MSFVRFKWPQILPQTPQKDDAARRIHQHARQMKMNNALDQYINKVLNFSFVLLKPIVGSSKSSMSLQKELL